ncbi:glycosyltransferase [Enterovibrio norvegicus]|uniref:glycosyltransferase n=1 Tax=Enterovibrio norvegicus TaxID=188144 RepID=UPI000CB7FA0C|nr:glycosyltransferase [Enterovibrio norvegicus]PML80833.1 glycosyl transferase family 1 [Enterovibrio norvegicus]PMN67363.1 glycosyl transferase family 1 [Enterovibrio norvegicus]
MTDVKRSVKSFIVSILRHAVRMSPFFVNLGYAAKIEILSVIYNEKTGDNDRLHDLSTYQGLGNNYNQALNGLGDSKLGIHLKKQACKTATRRNKYPSSNGSILFATRSWHFINPLYDSFKEKKVDCYKYDINDFDSLFFRDNEIKNKSKYHREKAFKNLGIAFIKKQDYNKENRKYMSDSFDDYYRKSDVIFVDWLNHNTNWVIENSSADKKIIVRVHSYEVLSFFPATINFGRIDGLIFISHGIRDMFFEMWGWLVPENIHVEVIDNIRCQNRINPSLIESNVNRKKIIGMMQYALPVKGFRFAFEVFKRVYEKDNEFKLVVCGQTLNEIKSKENDSLLEEIRLLPKGTVEELGYISEVDSFFRSVGYMLSTSEREGSHESIIEGMAYGCVPVVRSWPLLAPFNGAQRAFPMCQVIENVDEAAKLILDSVNNYDDISNKFQQESMVYFSEDIPNKYLEFIERVRKE